MKYKSYVCMLLSVILMMVINNSFAECTGGAPCKIIIKNETPHNWNYRDRYAKGCPQDVNMPLTSGSDYPFLKGTSITYDLITGGPSCHKLENIKTAAIVVFAPDANEKCWFIVNLHPLDRKHGYEINKAGTFSYCKGGYGYHTTTEISGTTVTFTAWVY